MPNTYRVVQWNTGNVGKSSLKSIAANPLLELVGCFAWSPEKAGRDAGELVGIAPLGIAATNDVDALLALKPDCVVYNPMWIDVDELVRILSAGVNVVTTASFITGQNLGDGRDRLIEACEKGGSTIFGSGVSPGFAELLAIVSAMVCNRVDKVTVNEAADTTFYDSPETEKPVGFGQPIDHPDLQAMAAKGTAIFGEAVELVGDALGVELDDVRCEAEFAQTTADLEMASWTIPAGCVAGVYISWQGILDGKTRHRPQRPLAQRSDARTGLEDRQRRLGHSGRRPADGDHQGRLPAATVFRGHHDRGVHGPRAHHDVGAGDQRDPGRRCRSARYRDLRRSAADAAARVRQNLDGGSGPGNVLQLALKVGAVLGDRGTQELVRLYLRGAPREVVRQETRGRGGVGVNTHAEPVAGDFGDVRVEVVRPEDAELATEQVVEIGVRVGVRRRGQADRRGDGCDRKTRELHGPNPTFVEFASAHRHCSPSARRATGPDSRYGLNNHRARFLSSRLFRLE